MLKIYHNPRCSKSRQTLQLIKDEGKAVQVVEYLSEVPAVSELTELITKLGISPIELIRKNESIFKEKFKGKTFNDAEWIRIMHENPKLIERPIVVKGGKAVIGRPPESVRQLF